MKSVISATNYVLQQTNNDINNGWPSASNGLGQSLLIMLFLLLVLFFVYRYLKKGNKYIQGNQNLEKIETLQLAYQTYVQIIRVGEKYILIGINKDKITFLTDVDEIIKPEENTELVKGFDSYLKKFVKKEKTKNTEDKVS